MTNSSFTDRERAAWHKERRRVRQGISVDESSPLSCETCIHCGAPLSESIPDGYEAALCGACE